MREEVKQGQPVRHLFTDGRGPFTLRLWVTFVANLIGLNALASNAYPTFIRSTGTGWASGARRARATGANGKRARSA